jgi:hypothetical protein
MDLLGNAVYRNGNGNTRGEQIMAVAPGGNAPYGPPGAVVAVIEQQRERGLVSPVNASTLIRIGVSESLTKRVLQALRILDFIDAEGNVTPEFADLRKVPSPEYKPRLAEMFSAAYIDVLSVVNPSGATLEAIHDACRTLEPAGQRDRMVTLFLGLLEYTEQWPDLPKPRVTSATGAAKGSGSKGAKATQVKQAPRRQPPPSPPPSEERPPAGAHSRTVKLKSGGSVTLVVDVNPLSLKGTERTFFFDLVDRLDEYESAVTD